MKRLLFTLVVLGAVATGSFAQNSDPTASKSGGMKLNIGIETGLPVGDAGDVYSWLIGGSVKLEVPTATNTYLTLSAGYSSFLIKSEFKDLVGGVSTDNFVPLKAGIKCYTGSNFFVEGQAGIVFSTAAGGGHAFVYSPGVGYDFGGLEVGVRFEGWTNGGSTNQVGLRVGYRF